MKINAELAYDRVCSKCPLCFRVEGWWYCTARNEKGVPSWIMLVERNDNLVAEPWSGRNQQIEPPYGCPNILEIIFIAEENSLTCADTVDKGACVE